MSRGFLFDADAGLLLHPTSLPGEFGVGDFGPVAHAWLEKLTSAEQSLWQVLPLHPPGLGNSPYQATSAFAGSPLLISPELLMGDGLLTDEELAVVRHPGGDRVDYVRAGSIKESLLRAAHVRFEISDAFAASRLELGEFARREADWLDDYALFEALRTVFGTEIWTDWPARYRDRDVDALAEFGRVHAEDVRRAKFVQWVFDRQWRAVRERATALGIRIVGDLPIFVSHGSADVWARRELFRLDEGGEPELVAGVPPDYFSETGQLWGNPIYAWSQHEDEDFAWWRARMRRELAWADVVRIDHFRGFSACWEVPGGEETAENGAWVPSPGRALLQRLRDDCGEPMPVIAEDLGEIDDDVRNLRDDFGLPGVRVLQFAFGEDESAKAFLPENYVRNCVAYSGTHDNDTVVGWFGQDGDEEVAAARDYLGVAAREVHRDVLDVLFRSKAGAVILPLQDVLGLGAEARMNVPGTAEGNWEWRLGGMEMLGEEWERLGAR